MEKFQGPPWAKAALAHLKVDEALTTPVSSKEKFVQPKYGYNCKNCSWIWIHPNKEIMNILQCRSNPEWISGKYYEDLEELGYVQYMHRRCNPCGNKKARWKRAKKAFVQLDLLRMNEEIPNLKFITKTHDKWTIKVPFDDNWMEAREKHKTKCLKFANNWRQRNAWWRSKNVLGQYWPECVVTINILEGTVKLHFHLHIVAVCEFLSNKPKRIWATNTAGEIVEEIDDSEFHKEWGGIIDIRTVKDYQVKYQVNGETRRGCGRKACMRYLTKYISKAEKWSSRKIGDW